MKKNKNLDELFREKLLNYEQEPPAYLLENILNANAGAHRKRRIILWRVAGIAAAVLLAFVAGWQLNTRNIQELKQPVMASSQTAPEKTTTSATELTDQQSEMKSEQLAANDNQTTARKSETSIRKEISLTAALSTDKENDTPSLIKPLKSLSGLLKSNAKIGNNLQKRKGTERTTDWSEKTIDQQIMEQNQQMAQAEKIEKNKGRWLVGAQVSPGYSVERSSHTQLYASNMLNSSSGTPIDLGGGISVEYKPGKRWSLQSGIYYSGIEQSSGNSTYATNKEFLSADRGSEYFNAPVNLVASKMMMNSAAGVIEFKSIPTGMVLGTNPEDKTMASAVVVSDARFVQNFDYIEIPLYLRYTLLDSKFGIEMLGGFSSNLLVGNETFMDSQSGKSSVGKTQDMETLNYSGTLGVGLKYGLSKRLYLNVEPRIKYYLNSLNSNSSVTYKPYTVGVFTGLSYEF